MSRPHAGLIPLAAALLALACAQATPPPGGVEDRMPPRIVATTPDTLSIVESLDGPVVFRFNERISERGITNNSVLVSPRTGDVKVKRGREEIRVEVEKVIEDLAKRSIRCLAVARTSKDGAWHMAGILTFLDPPRPDTKITIVNSRRYGVGVKGTEVVTFSGYVPAATSMVSPGLAASITGWIVMAPLSWSRFITG